MPTRGSGSTTSRGNWSRSLLAQVLLAVPDHTRELGDASLIERELVEVVDPTVYAGGHSIQHGNGGARPDAEGLTSAMKRAPVRLPSRRPPSVNAIVESP